MALPGATHTGQNVVACYVNGNAFIASGHMPTGMGFFNWGDDYFIYDSLLAIEGSNWNNESIHLSIKFTGLGTYNLTQNNSQPPFAYYQDTGSAFSSINGSVTISYYDGNILAGKFAFDGKSASGSIVHVTNGEFDIAGK